MAQKYYAVRQGKVPGIYESWDACRAQVHGYSQAIYKSFPTREEAEKFMQNGVTSMADTPAEEADITEQSRQLCLWRGISGCRRSEDRIRCLQRS